MKVKEDVVQSLSKRLLEYGAREVFDGTEEVFHSDDVMVHFSNADGKVFQGLSFEMIGRDFNVLPNLELAISEDTRDEATASSEAAEVYIVEDEELVNLTNDYLTWRTQVLEKLKL